MRASSRPLVTVAAIAVILVTAIEGTIVATVMPQIVGQLGRFDLFSWVFTAYLLTQAVTIPLYGRLADIYGRKRMLLIAVGLFLFGSLMCGFAGGMVSLIVFRVVQGTGAGGLVPLAQTVVGDMYTPVERARIQGWLSSVWAIGSIIGPLLGAFLVAHTIWPMVFWINIPIGAIAAGMLILWLREKLQQRQHRIDYVGALLMVSGSGLLMFAVVQATHLGAVLVTALLVAAVALLTLLVFYEKRAPEPMIPIELLQNRVIAAGTLGSCALGAIMMGATAFVSLYVQGVMGRSAMLAGLVLMTPSLTWPIGSISGGWMMLKTSYRTTTLIGTLPLLVGSCADDRAEPGERRAHRRLRRGLHRRRHGPHQQHFHCRDPGQRRLEPARCRDLDHVVHASGRAIGRRRRVRRHGQRAAGGHGCRRRHGRSHHGPGAAQHDLERGYRALDASDRGRAAPRLSHHRGAGPVRAGEPRSCCRRD